MQLRPEAMEGFKNWCNKMTTEGKQELLNIFCRMCKYVEAGNNLPSVAAFLKELPELERISDMDFFEIFRALSEFHPIGSYFRYDWNLAFYGENYASYLEADSRKHFVCPFSKPPKIPGFDIFPPGDSSDGRYHA